MSTPPTALSLRLKKMGLLAVAIGSLYLLLPLIVFDFTSVAVPYDESNFGTQLVAIGPQPRWWIPWAAHDFHIPGGPGYDPSSWPFIVWKPLCIQFVRAKGYALPAAWR